MKTKQWLLAIAAVMLLAACEDVFAPEKAGKSFVRAADVTLDQTNLIMSVGETQVIIATVSPDNAANKAVIWSSKAPSVAVVDNGVITARAVGTAVITVITKDGGRTAICTVKVLPTISVSGVTLDKTNITLTAGEVEPLTADIQPYNAANKNISWSSSDEEVAGVDDSGLVTAIAEGSAVITVTTEDGGKTAECTVTVEADDPSTVHITGVSLNKTSLTITAGDEETLVAEISPADATKKDVTWSSDKPAVARVDQDGKVTTITAGTAIITVTTRDGGKTAQCTITVEAAPVGLVTGVTLNTYTLTLTAGTGTGNTATLTVTVQPLDAINKTVSWSSNNTSAATVSNGVVTAVAPGTAIITVTTEDGGKTAQCTVTVNARPVTSVTLNKSTLTLMIDEEETLIPTVNPAGATNKTVSWDSNDTDVATVDQNGKVIAVDVGTTTITVTTEDGGKTAQCTVTVTPAHKKIKITNIAGNIIAGGNLSMNIRIDVKDSLLEVDYVAAGEAKIINDSITFSLMTNPGIPNSYWNSTGEYYIEFKIPITDGWEMPYIYTNGQSFAELGISDYDDIDKAAKINITDPVTEIDLSKFVMIYEALSSRITITGLKEYNSKLSYLDIRDPGIWDTVGLGAAIVNNGTATFYMTYGKPWKETGTYYLLIFVIGSEEFDINHVNIDSYDKTFDLSEFTKQ